LSRIPRAQEHLQTAFTGEAASAAQFRAYAVRAGHDGLPNLARRWLRLAAAKDRLASELLVAAEQVRGPDSDLGSAIAEERYENDVLYPKMIRDVEEPHIRALFEQVVEEQRRHVAEMEALRRYHNAAQGDVQLPPEVDEGSAPAAAPSSAGTRTTTAASH
jgi:rubrerythrin